MPSYANKKADDELTSSSFVNFDCCAGQVIGHLRYGAVDACTI